MTAMRKFLMLSGETSRLAKGYFSCSSPRTCPQRGGGTVRRVFSDRKPIELWPHLGSTKSGVRRPLSLRERAGVRGKGATERPRRSIRRTGFLFLLSLPVLVVGCTSTNPKAAFDDVSKTVGARSGHQVRWMRDNTEITEIEKAVDALLQT